MVEKQKNSLEWDEKFDQLINLINHRNYKNESTSQLLVVY